MTNPLNDSDISDALRRFDATPWEAACCAHQDSFEVFTLTVRQQAKGELEAMLPKLGAMPFSEVNRMIVVLGFGAVREGARALAALAPRHASPASLPAVGYDPLLDELTRLMNPTGTRLVELRQLLESLPAIDAVIAAAEQSLRERLVACVPELESHEDEVRSILVTNLLHGVRCEFLYPRLAIS
jgi:hypothetical protein